MFYIFMVRGFCPQMTPERPSPEDLGQVVGKTHTTAATAEETPVNSGIHARNCQIA